MNFYQFAAKLLPTKSVDSIVAFLIKLADQLAAAEIEQVNRANSIAEEIAERTAQFNTLVAQLKDEETAALAEADRASRIRKNVEKITA